jgi:hypothetical protein
MTKAPGGLRKHFERYAAQYGKARALRVDVQHLKELLGERCPPPRMSLTTTSLASGAED